MKKPFFIAVEGPIGVGKTTLSKYISENLSMHSIKEIVEENPFLGKFYDDIDEWSFQTEMFFLCNRFKQLDDVKKNYLTKGKSVVSDYHIFKNIIFANRTLSEEHYEKYLEIYKILTKDMPKPNVVVHLNASLDTLLKRIDFRGRQIEENIDVEYLKRLSEDYKVFFDNFKKENPEIPILTYNGDEVDFVNNKVDLEHILKEIENEIKITE